VIRRWSTPDAGRDDGMVTAELAAALPVLVLLTLVAMSAVLVSAQRIRAEDAAREAARAIARGDPASAQQYARSTAPSATLTVSRTADYVTVEARIEFYPLGHWLPTVTVLERAVAATEADTDGDTLAGVAVGRRAHGPAP
jgi:TadE-like protein